VGEEENFFHLAYAVFYVLCFCFLCFGFWVCVFFVFMFWVCVLCCVGCVLCV